MPKRRGESGQFVETVTLEDVLEVFDAVEGPPVVTSADVAEMTGLSRDSARRKLEELIERGDVGSRRTAGRVLYWRVDNTPRERRAPARGPSEGETGDKTDEEEADATAATAAAERAEKGTDPIADLDLPGSGSTLEARQDAVRTMYEYLQDRGRAAREELVELVDPEAVRYQDRNSFWQNIVGGKQALAELPGVESPGSGSHLWTYEPGEGNA